MLAAAVTNVIAVHLCIDTTPIEYRGANDLRATGLLGNANVLAINLSLAAIVVWLIPKIPFFIRIIALFVTFYGIAVSGSRKGVILGALLLLLVVLKLIRKSSLAAQTALLGSFFVGAVIYFQYLDKIASFLNDNVLAINRFSLIFYDIDTSFSERKWFIDTGLQIWKEEPFFGKGLGQFSIISGSGAYSHNNYIELLVSGGILALVLYYLLYLVIIYKSYRTHRLLFLYSLLIVGTLIFTDMAMVSFTNRANMIFVAFVLWYFSLYSAYDYNLPSEAMS